MDNIKEGGYFEYNQLLVSYNQVIGLTTISPNICYTFEHNFNDIKTYINTGFLTLEDHFSKYYEKLDFKKFNEVLTFLNKVGNWELVSFSALYGRTHDNPYAFLYVFKREI